MLSKSKAKYIQSLQHKKFRDEYKVFVAEGFKLVNELLSKGGKCVQLYLDVERFSADKLVGDNRPMVEDVRSFEMEKLSALKEPPGILAVFEQFPFYDPVNESGLILCLDRIQDPGNMGTIIRTAAWFGVKNIVCNTGTIEIYNPKVVQSTMAALADVNIYFSDLKIWLKNYQHSVIVTSMSGKDLKSVGQIENAAIIIGNEANGVDAEILSSYTDHISITGSGKTESLNAAIATGIILFAINS